MLLEKLVDLHLEHFVLLISLFINLLQIFSWLRSSQRKSFAAEQEFRSILASLSNIVYKQNEIQELIIEKEEKNYREIKQVEAQIVRDMNELKGLINPAVIKILGGSSK